jgi:hypothetical protein
MIRGRQKAEIRVLSDRFTAKVLGCLALVFVFIIDVSCFIFAKPELRARPGFAAIIVVPSLPIIAFGIWLLRRANKLKDAGD